MKYKLVPQSAPVPASVAKAFEASFTPYPVALQAMQRAVEYFGHAARETLRVIDPAAGAGVWCQVARAVLPSAWIYAVEVRRTEAPWLRANADDHDVADFLSLSLSNGAFDLAVTNPPFSLFAAFADEGLRVADECWLYAPCDISMRSEDGAHWLEKHQRFIAAEFTTLGTVAFNGGSSADFRHYSLWCLSNRSRCGGWYREVLPLLPPTHRRWVPTQRPGTVPR